MDDLNIVVAILASWWPAEIPHSLWTQAEILVSRNPLHQVKVTREKEFNHLFSALKQHLKVF